MNCYTRIKICGITGLDDALYAAELGVEALGFNFYPKSPRYVEPARARDIIRQLPPFLTTVGIFVQAAQEKIDEIVRQTGIQIVQLHGDEPPEFCRACKHKMIKAFRVGDEFDLHYFAEYDVSAFLLDTYKKGIYGGTGAAFDWNIAIEAKRYGHIVLAGGLTPDNIEAAIKTAEPYAVDVGSGVEAAPGKKDHAKMEALVARVRNAPQRC